MIITINDDLTSSVTTDDNLSECFIPSYNPETLVPFSSKDEVQAFADSIISNINYFSPKLSDSDKAELIHKNFLSSKAAFILSIKTDAGNLTQEVLFGLGSEYELAEKEATLYKGAGYPTNSIPNTVSDEIASKAAKGITVTATVACNTIISAAIEWRTAQSVLRRNRLITSSAAEMIIDNDQLNDMKEQWAGFMLAIKSQLGA